MNSITVTTQKAINYGAVLQALALHKIQGELGIDNRLLNLPSLSKMFMPIPKMISKQMLIACAVNLTHILHLKEQRSLRYKFDRFLSQNISQTKEYGSIAELTNDPPIADFYINGSDQVFGLRGEFDLERMLQFGDEITKRYSYAASLGEYDWSEEEKKTFARMIEKFSMISVREQYAKEYIEGFANVSCEVHVDPVFLLQRDEWDAIAAERIVEEDYILCYPLIGNSDTQTVLDELKKKTGLKTVCVQTFPRRRVKADKYIFDAGPEEFLSLFKHAKYIVTTSFHGTAFSLIFEKPFYTMIKNYKSQRMTDLLNMVGLSERIYSPEISINDDDIDFSQCRKIIKEERQRGIDYLKRVIEDASKKE